MIHTIYWRSEDEAQTQVAPEALPASLSDQTGVLWLDLAEEPEETCRPILRDIFNFHPLAIDDALAESHLPKIDDWGEYVYLVLHGIVFDVDSRQIDTVELDIFIGRNYLVTYQTQSIAAIDRVWSACQRDERHLKQGPGRLLYRIADELVTDYMPVVEAMDEAIDTIEDTVFSHPQQQLLEKIFSVKRATLYLRRIIGPQREVLNKLARGDFPIIAEEHRVFYRDVYDHLVRLHEIAEGLRDLVGGVLDTYLSAVNNRMNEVMKTLTVITTLFMPIAFLTGFFGMNFFQPVVDLSTWTGRSVFILVLMTMIALPTGMFLWMRRRAWM